MKKRTWLCLFLISLLVLCAGCSVNTPAPEPTPTQNVETTHKEEAALKQEPTAPVAEEQQPSRPVSLTERYVQEVEAACEADSLLPEYQSTAGMCELNGKYANRWADIADEYYQKLLAYEHDEDYSTPFCTVEEFRTALIDMKTDHKEYVEKEMTAYNTILKYEYQGGSISGVISSGHRCSLEKEWALKILNICAMLGIE